LYELKQINILLILYGLNKAYEINDNLF